MIFITSRVLVTNFTDWSRKIDDFYSQLVKSIENDRKIVRACILYSRKVDRTIFNNKY